MNQTRVAQLTDLIIRKIFVCKDRESLKKHLDPDVMLFAPENSAGYSGPETVSRYLIAKRDLVPGRLQLESRTRILNPLSGSIAIASAVIGLSGERKAAEDLFFIHIYMILKKSGHIWKALHIYCYPSPEADRLGERQGALLDPLTGIFNTEGLVSGIETLIRQNKDWNFALLCFGINDFRYINKLYGYQVGDQILKSVAKNISSQCKEHELCGRTGGDDFALLVQYAQKEDVPARLKELTPALVDAQIDSLVSGGIYINCGIYFLSFGENCAVKDILDKASLAQKNALKKKWENNYACYSPEMERSHLEQQYLLEQAVLALQKREFQLYIQPQVDIKTLAPVGGEALVRWIKADGTVIMPGTFIPLLEKSGFIRDFDFYMLRQLCSHMRKWLDAGLKVCPISINQSRLHLKEPGYLDRFCRIADMWDIPHHLISFELTESIFTEYNREVHTLSQKLKEKGFRLDIDDFGTGYTALNLFSNVTADVLKIDRSVLACFQSPKGGIVIKKIIEMAQEIGMQVICEGVETKEQLLFLQELNCDMGQGFYFYRPMPAKEFQEKLLAQAL